MTAVKVVDVLDVPFVDDAWALYVDAFGELDALAVQRHLMFRSEFNAVAADGRVGKYLAFDADRLTGVAAFTNVLEAWPLISPAYFARHFPADHAAGRVWYCGFVACRRAGRGMPDMSTFADLVDAMWADAGGGLVVVDVCRHNTDVRRLPGAVRLLLERRGGVEARPLDEQTYWAYRAAS